MNPGALAPPNPLPIDSPGIITLVSSFAVRKVDQVKASDGLERRSIRMVGHGTCSIEGNRYGEDRMTTWWRVPQHT